jgi:hypothetical protein
MAGVYRVSQVSTRDLMAQMGHDSMHAALIYQLATSGADRAIADSLDARLSTRVADHDSVDGRGDESDAEPDDEAG